MTKILYGERIGKTAQLTIGCAAVIFDESRQKILLTRRTDNGQWCLPGGAMEAGEDVSECCIRETWEETGLQVEIVRLIGVYSNPHRIMAYADGNRRHIVSLCFEAKVLSGELTLNSEVSEFGYFEAAEIEKLDLLENHRERIVDAFANRAGPSVA